MQKILKTGDKVKVIAGSDKGKEGKIVKVCPKTNKACVEGLGIRTRHMKKTQFNPAGGKKEIHTGIDLSNLALVEKAKETKAAAKPAKKAKKEGK